MEQKTTCKDKVREQLKGRIDDLRKLWEADQEGNEEGIEDLGTFNEYGLGFDYVAPGTFEGQRRGYFCYQLSWGGPSDEFRFFCDERLKPTRIEYWFLDWFDGAKIILKGKDLALLTEIWGFFEEIGAAGSEMERALQN